MPNAAPFFCSQFCVALIMDIYSSLSGSDQKLDYRLLLVTLNDDVLNTIKKGSEKLYIKSKAKDHGYPVITTESKTFKIRLQNQSNSVILLNSDNIDDKPCALSYDKFVSRLILEDVDPQVPTAKLETISETEDFSRLTDYTVEGSDDGYTLKDLLDDSTASPEEFKKLVPLHQIIEYKGNCYVVEDKLVTECLEKMLELLIKSIISSGYELEVMEKLEQIELERAKNEIWVPELSRENIPEQVIDLCIEKFISQGKLNHDRVVHQFGLEILIKRKELKMDDFMINLKLRMPFNYSPEINLKRSMRGSFFTYSDNSVISYLDENLLSLEPLRRFQQLFALKPVWEVDEIEPFVQKINRRNTKIEKFLIKYCKVKRAGKKHLASPR
ncbi:hypothetical protein FOA43_004430 [Brettanomyces nanus]|uniref:Sister chromatid cohesion protein DCC1 n=1 Tax=Eeniella nana TaxID=13502 RepID=A0A875S803_EENNA|nr:uncharacterized protein FOA43_004430 [Brettanomyces nanus]QPG77033.1 hypothetical protein FOA43_004430 [Brettanomyces nanus]